MTLETMQAVVGELNTLKLDAVLEYPGFIRVGRMCAGDANDTIDADLYELDDLNQIGLSQPIETIESDIPRDSSDVQRIVNFLYYVSVAAKEAGASL